MARQIINLTLKADRALEGPQDIAKARTIRAAPGGDRAADDNLPGRAQDDIIASRRAAQPEARALARPHSHIADGCRHGPCRLDACAVQQHTPACRDIGHPDGAARRQLSLDTRVRRCIDRAADHNRARGRAHIDGAPNQVEIDAKVGLRDTEHQVARLVRRTGIGPAARAQRARRDRALGPDHHVITRRRTADQHGSTDPGRAHTDVAACAEQARCHSRCAIDQDVTTGCEPGKIDHPGGLDTNVRSTARSRQGICRRDRASADVHVMARQIEGLTLKGHGTLAEPQCVAPPGTIRGTASVDGPGDRHLTGCPDDHVVTGGGTRQHHRTAAPPPDGHIAAGRGHNAR